MLDHLCFRWVVCSSIGGMDRTGIDPRLVVAADFTEEQRRAFVYAVGRGKSRAEAARSCVAGGVPWSWVSRALEADGAFRDAVEMAEVEKWSLAEDGLYSALVAEEPWAIKLVVQQSRGLRDRWKPADVRVESVSEIGPGAASVIELVAAVEARRMELAAPASSVGESVMDLDSSEGTDSSLPV